MPRAVKACPRPVAGSPGQCSPSRSNAPDHVRGRRIVHLGLVERCPETWAGIGEDRVPPWSGVSPWRVGASLTKKIDRPRLPDQQEQKTFRPCHLPPGDDQVTREAPEGRLIRHYADLARFLDSCLDPWQRQAAEQTGLLRSMAEALTLFAAERLNLLAMLGLAVDQGWDEQVVQLSESMGESLTFLRYGEGRTLKNAGNVYREMRFAEAISCLQGSLPMYRESGERHGESIILTNLGGQDLGLPDRAAVQWLAMHHAGDYEEAAGP